MSAALKKPRVPPGVAACASGLLALVALGALAAHAAASGADCRRWRTCRATALSRLRARAPAAPDGARGRVRGAVRAGESARAGRAAHRPVASCACRPSAAARRRTRCSCSPAVPGRRRAASTPPPPAPSRRILRERDIVLVDQRGTGRSNPLDCPAEAQDPQESASPQVIAASTRACLASLAGRADVAWYTTSVAVEDLESVRAALGDPRIDLYGASYGTRVAQQYLRRYPQHTRALILDGVVPVGRAVGADTRARGGSGAARHPRALREGCALPRRVRRPCAGLPRRACRARGRALPVKLADPASGEPRSASSARRSSRACCAFPPMRANTPRSCRCMLHAAAARADYAPLAAQQLLFERAYAGELATGMHNSVVCAEDVPFFDEQQPRPRAAGGDLPRYAAARGPAERVPHLAARAGRCGSARPAHQRGAGAAAVRERRPGDPARLGCRKRCAPFPQASASFSQGFGHGQLTAPCVDRLMAQFLRARRRCRGSTPAARARPPDALLHLAQRAAAVIEALGLSKRFGAVAAVREVSLAARRRRASPGC